MSLKSTSQCIRINTDERPVDPYSDEPMGKIPEIRIVTQNCSVEGTKAAFMEAMEEFANSEHFKAMTYQLGNEFTIKVHHSVTLSMPR